MAGYVLLANRMIKVPSAYAASDKFPASEKLEFLPRETWLVFVTQYHADSNEAQKLVKLYALAINGTRRFKIQFGKPQYYANQAVAIATDNTRMAERRAE